MDGQENASTLESVRAGWKRMSASVDTMRGWSGSAEWSFVLQYQDNILFYLFA